MKQRRIWSKFNKSIFWRELRIKNIYLGFRILKKTRTKQRTPFSLDRADQAPKPLPLSRSFFWLTHIVTNPLERHQHPILFVSEASGRYLSTKNRFSKLQKIEFIAQKEAAKLPQDYNPSSVVNHVPKETKFHP